MKKAAAVVLAAVVAISALAACAPDRAGNDVPAKTDGSKPADNENKGIAYNKIVFEEIKDIETLPADVKGAVEILKMKRGYRVFPVEEGYLVFVGSGEKPTGGYTIKTLSVEDIEGMTKITMEEKAPKPEDIVTEALTHPFVVIRMKGVAETFQVFNDKGQRFEDLSGSLVKEGDAYLEVIQADGQFSGQIDGTSIEVMVNGKALAFRHEGKLQEAVEKLRQGDSISVVYYKNKNGQLMLTQILQVVFTGGKKGSEELVMTEGEYVGQIDGNSIEIILKGEPNAFRHEGKLQEAVEDLKKGDTVAFSYYANEHGQLILTAIEKHGR